MFLLRSRNYLPGCSIVHVKKPNHLPPANVNGAAADIAMLDRLAGYAMQLAERATQEALSEPAPPAGTKPSRARPDPRMVFLRLSATVRACLALKYRLAAGKLPAAPSASPAKLQSEIESIVSKHLSNGHAASALPMKFA